MAFTPFSAKNSKFRIGAVVLTAKQWNAVPEVDELDVTNFESGGFYDAIGGVKKLTMTVEFDLDAAQNHLDGVTLNLTPGTILTGVKAYWQNTAGPYWDMPSALVKTTPNSMNVKEAAKGSVTLVGKGTWTVPQGTFVPV